MENKQKPLYLTTTLPYVNDKPHVGHALEFTQADVVARAARRAGRPVFFNTGADEHGQKIYQKAGEAGKTPQEYVDHYAAQLKKLEDKLNLSNDAFIRTTDPKHIAAVQEWWRRAEAAGDIYKKKFKGLYCVSDEMYLKDQDMEHGRCINHPDIDPIEVEEENYFFRFSKYQESLLDYLKKDNSILPESRRAEAIAFVENGLEDFSISRVAEKMPWGVPVPGDDSQVVYVWFDALTNYISTLGWPDETGDFATFWDDGEVVQMAGKDQVRFQSLIWQAMLMSAGIKNSDHVFYHGFINSGGRKMSKSVGNVIDPIELVDEYGIDALRYYLLRHIHPTDDSDLTREKFHESYTAHLVNGLGNLVNRVLTMAHSYGVTWGEQSFEESWQTVPARDDIRRHLGNMEFHLAMDGIWALVGELDKRIDEEKPFAVAKTDPDQAGLLVAAYLPTLISITKELEPVLPETAKDMKAAINDLQKPSESLFPRINLR